MMLCQLVDPLYYDRKLEQKKAMQKSKNKTARVKVYLIIHYLPDETNRVVNVYAKRVKAEERVQHLIRQYSQNQYKHTFHIIEKKILGCING